jgi:hypothetical protein
MTRRTIRIAIGFILAGVFAGCSGERDPRDLLGPGEAGTIVVDARLIVGSVFPDVRLETTQSPEIPYDRDAAALSGARVWIIGPGADTVFYRDDGFGDYAPRPDSSGIFPIVFPRTQYRLVVHAPDGRIVTAETTTPGPFSVREWLLLNSDQTVRRPLAFTTPVDSEFVDNQLTYQDGLVEARFDRGSSAAFQVALHSLSTGSPLLIDADFISDEDLASIGRDTSSPPFDAADGTLRLPWLAVFYEGIYEIEIFSVDRNWYDLVRTIRFEGFNFGFGQNAGDDFERPVFHVDGGIGLFGSAAVSSNFFEFRPRP